MHPQGVFREGLTLSMGPAESSCRGLARVWGRLPEKAAPLSRRFGAALGCSNREWVASVGGLVGAVPCSLGQAVTSRGPGLQVAQLLVDSRVCTVQVHDDQPPAHVTHLISACNQPTKSDAVMCRQPQAPNHSSSSHQEREDTAEAPEHQE